MLHHCILSHHGKMAHEMPSQEKTNTSPEPRSGGGIHYPMMRKNMSTTRAMSIANHDVDEEDGPGAGVATSAL